jgi:parallel beta-helix repeat protein
MEDAMKTKHSCPIVFVLLMIQVSVAQTVPGWEGVTQLTVLPTNSSVISAYSDGYGQHMLTAVSNNIDYFLLGNDGQAIYSSPDPFPVSSQASSAAITGYAGNVYAAVEGASGLIKVYSSTNGGATWSASDGYTPPATVVNVDAFADIYGVHIVWDTEGSSNTEVYYVRYRPFNNDFVNLQHITDIGAITGKFPKIISGDSRLVVSFATAHLVDNSGASRDADISSGVPVWESNVRLTPTVSAVNFGNTNIAVQGNTLHMLLFEAAGPGGEDMYVSTRAFNPPVNWSAPSHLDNYGGTTGEDYNFRRRLVAQGDTVFATYAKIRSLGFPTYETSIRSRYISGESWSVPVDVFSKAIIEPPLNVALERPTLSASRLGQYFYWTDGLFGHNASRWFRRRVRSLFGDVIENMFWTGNNWITGTVTIQSGKTVTVKAGSTTNVAANAQIVVSAGANLIIEPGATMKFSSGAKIVAEGNLIAQGTQAQPIILRNDIAANQWGGVEASGNFTSPTLTLSYVNVSGTSGAGIHIGNTVNFTMQNSSVSGGTIGVEIVPGNSPGFPPPILLTKNTITGANDGFYLYSSSNVTMEENTLVGTGGGSGIACFGSSPTVLRNDIRGFKYGMFCATGSSPMLEKGLTGGNNLITENEYGVYATGGSSPNLGTIADPFDDGGQNSVFGNYSYDVVISGDDMTVIAQSNWWGTPGDPSSQFQINGTNSEVVYYPWLAEDPNPGSSLTGGKISSREKILGQGAGSDPIEIPLLMKQAMRERKRGNYAQATALLKAIVASGAMPQFAKHWALSQLLGVAQRMNRANLPAYLSSINQREFVRRAKSLLPLSHWSEGSTRDAMSAFDANIVRYPNSEVACAALYGKFIHALYNANDTEAAQLLLTRLHREYPQTAETEFAESQMRNYVGTNLTAGPTGINKAVAGQGQANTPTEFALLQNYPNPFNPTTTIRFAIPQNEHVTLKVYDLLGREVATLVDEMRNAGSYDETFDASRLASGVYVYKLVAGSFTLSRKLLLMR